MVDKIKSIGKDPVLLQETTRKLLSEQKSQLSNIEADGQYIRKELGMLRKQLKSGCNGQGRGNIEKQANDLSERIKQSEKQLSEINRQKILLESTQIDEKELKTALSLFDSIWDVLFPIEQVRVINLLIEKVIYNGEKKTVTINFRPLGIKTSEEEAEEK